jgi:hypothetical protein
MVESNQRHFYIFEPVQLRNFEVTVPIFFYTQETKIFAKCYTPSFKSNNKNTNIAIGIPEKNLFDNPNLKTIPIEEFELTYPEMMTKDGLALSSGCDGKISGEEGLCLIDKICASSLYCCSLT